MEINIYTDGALHPSTGKGGYAFIVVKDDKVIFSFFDGMLKTTNNRMELLAVIKAMHYLINSNYKSAEIFTDSKYIHNIICKNSNIKANKDLWIKFAAAFKKISDRVKFTWIKGHNGSKYNELVDQLAVKASNLINVSIS